MSVKIMGLVWDLDLPQNEKFVLLAYADHADHNGRNMFPAVETIAKKTGYSQRSVQRTTHSLEEKGYLIADGKGPKGTNKWKYGRGDILSGVTDEAQGVTSETERGDIAVSPEPSLTIKEPSLSERKKEAEERKTKQRAAKGDVVDLFIQMSPALKEQEQMRQRVENALHRNLDWDSARSPWNGYEKKLVRREKDNSQTIEGFMEWFNSDEFRKNGVIYLNPTKIEDWWLQAFETTLSYDEQLAKAGYK